MDNHEQSNEIRFGEIEESLNGKIGEILFVSTDLGEITPPAKGYISVPYDFTNAIGDKYKIIAKFPPCIAYTGSFAYNMIFFTNWQNLEVKGTVQMYAETAQKARIFCHALVVPK